MAWNVVVINESSVVQDEVVKGWLPALQTQVSRDFAGVWGVDAQLSFASRTDNPAADAWQLIVLDDSDQAGALGYHDVTSGGLPLGKVFAKTDQHYGNSISVTVSHELLEMLADPSIDMTFQMQDNNGGVVAFPLEVCDMCEADNYGYDINGVTVSDFGYPRWFDQRPNPPGAEANALDYGGHLTSTLDPANPVAAILPGGYIGMWTPAAGWTQVTGQARADDYSAIPAVGSRRERRTRRKQWLKSFTPDEIAAHRG